MVPAIPDILARVAARKEEELRVSAVSREALEGRARRQVRRDFQRAISGGKPAIIAEIKKASPSRGVLADDFHPALFAREYEAGGAAAISVLTDRDFFQGSLRDLETAREAVHIPVLRKDFTTSEYHVVEAAAHGADAILLIAAILDAAQLRAFRELAAAYGMAAIVEVHDEAELESALKSGAPIIGVNNRDLRTFEVRLETSLRLAGHIPAGVLKISESGIFTAAHVQELSSAGYSAFLVGESLMKSADRVKAIEALCS